MRLFIISPHAQTHQTKLYQHFHYHQLKATLSSSEAPLLLADKTDVPQLNHLTSVGALANSGIHFACLTA